MYVKNTRKLNNTPNSKHHKNGLPGDDGNSKATLRVGVVDVGVGRLSVEVRQGGEAGARTGQLYPPVTMGA